MSNKNFLIKNEEISLKNICVYCGSSLGRNPIYKEAATRLGIEIVKAGFGLVYGGGQAGLMGEIVKAVKSESGHVIGVMPSSLVNIEMAYKEVDKYYEVNSFHERKMLMFQLSDAFVALPGGPGTLEELVEQISWFKSGYHQKPIIIVNTNGYWNYFLNMLDKIQIIEASDNKKKLKYTIIDQPEELIGIVKKKNL